MRSIKKISILTAALSTGLMSGQKVLARGFEQGLPSDFFSSQLREPGFVSRQVPAAEISSLKAMTLRDLVAKLGPGHSESSQVSSSPPKGVPPARFETGPDAIKPKISSHVSLTSLAEKEDMEATLAEVKILAQTNPSQPIQQVTLSIEVKDSLLKVASSEVTLSRIGNFASVVLPARYDVQLFSRNPKIMRWNPSSKRLEAKAEGITEIYVTFEEQLKIIRATVKGSDLRDPLLAGSGVDFLQKLTTVIPSQEKPLAYSPGSREADSAAESSSRPGEDRPRDLTLAQTLAEVDASKSLVEEQQKRFSYPEAPSYRRVAVQVMDERSAPEQSLVYPSSDVNVKLLGTRVAAKTDLKGLAYFGEVPEGSRFWVMVDDEKGRYVPTVSEVSLDAGSSTEVLRVKSISYRTYFAYQNVLEVTQDSGLASFCARAMNSNGTKPLSGLRVSLNLPAEGPFYFGNFGPQRGIDATGIDGRFCFFNVQPGLGEISFSDVNGYLTAVTVPTFPGAHSEEDLALENQSTRSIVLAALPTATEQVYEDAASSQEYFHIVNSADVITVGDNEPLSYVSPGIYAHERRTSFKGRIYTLAQTPEFENIVASLDENDQMTGQMPVMPLLPRGFAEDLYHELHQQDSYNTIPFDPALGQAVVFHKLGSEKENVKISIINSTGRVLQEAWYFGNTPGLIKAAFFNLEPGVYQVLVESQSGAILASDTTAVDYWTTALVQTGGSVSFHKGLSQNHASAELTLD